MSTTKTKTRPPAKPKKRTVHFVISDPKGDWFNMALHAIEQNAGRLHPDEKTPQNLVRLLLKNADTCIKAIRPENV